MVARFLSVTGFAAVLALTNCTDVRANTFVVNTADDRPDSTLNDDICDTQNDPNASPPVPPSGICTLRAAIDQANATPGFHIIELNTAQIHPASQLPSITKPVIIRRLTTLLVTLDGFMAGPNARGLIVTGGGSTISGLNIVRFGAYAIELSGGAGNTVEGCWIGLSTTGTTTGWGNGFGIMISGSNGNTIGGTTAASRNVISGNKNVGIWLAAGSTKNKILGNHIGTDVSGTMAVANQGPGVLIEDSPVNTIGGLTAEERNVISGNATDGVRLMSKGSTGNVVLGNYIGTAADGTTAIPNVRIGVYIFDASTNTIGGTSAAARNVISGNDSDGIAISGTGSTTNNVWGNYIGTDKSGTNAVGNRNGVFISGATGTEVGGANVPLTQTMYRNLISGNRSNGVLIQAPGATGNNIRGNYIGPDVTGSARLVNSAPAPAGQGIGIFIVRSPRNTIGGPTEAERNIISANNNAAVTISGLEAVNNKVLGNYLGTDVTGTGGLANETAGVFVNDAPDTEIGAATPVPGTPPGNLISANRGVNRAGAVHIQGPESRRTKVKGNIIGARQDGKTALANLSDGVYIENSASRSEIGGLAGGEGNIIAFNDRVGVAINSGARHSVLSNVIHSNKNLGIDLSLNGVSPNQATNPGVGPNNLQNYPVLTNYTRAGAVEGELVSSPKSVFTVQLFTSTETDPTDYGQGAKLGATNQKVTTDAAGKARFSMPLAIAADEYVTAIATDPNGNSSEFSHYLIFARFRAVSSNPETQASEGVFVAGSRSPVAVTPANFGELKFGMRPVKVSVYPAKPNSMVELSYESGDATKLELYLDDPKPTQLTLPKTWNSPADFQNRRLDVPLLAYGKAFGEVVLKLTYKQGTKIFAEERLKFRVEPFAGAVGVVTNGKAFPFFRVVRTVNVGSPVNAALDAVQHRERLGAKADVYLVPHRTPAQWAANQGLADVAGGAKPFTLTAGSIVANATALWAAAAQGQYDIVYDFGNFPDDPANFVGDSKLDPGDIIDFGGGLAGLFVEPSMTAPGAGVPAMSDYGMAAPAMTFAVPGGYDGLPPAPLPFRTRGRVVYPAGLVNPAPLVVILHGNHPPLSPVAKAVTSDENFRGYTYLQDHLASRGYITLSVDLDEVSGLYPGISMRAWIGIKNVERLISDKTIAGGALQGKIDTSRIYLIGHSRGGEAVIVILDQLKNPAARPGGAAVAGFGVAGIKGIVSMSPVTQAVTAGPVAPQDVPFLLLYGSADGDVNGAMQSAAPFRHYDRATGDKFAIRIIGANHNHFNTSWSIDDAVDKMGALGGAIVKVPLPGPVGAGLIAGPAQRGVALAYITAFLSLVNDQDEGARAFFLEPPSLLAPLGTPGVALHGQARLTASAKPTVIDDYSANFPAAGVSSSGNAVTSSVANLSEAKLFDGNLALETEPFNRFFQESNGALFEWAAPSDYTLALAAADQDLRGTKYICFRIAQQPKDPKTIALGGVMTVSVELEDASAQTIAISVGAIDTTPGIYPANIGVDTTSAAFKTFRIPVAGFSTDGAKIDLSKISKIRIKLAGKGDSPTGRVSITDIELEK